MNVVCFLYFNLNFCSDNIEYNNLQNFYDLQFSEKRMLIFLFFEYEIIFELNNKCKSYVCM